MKKKTGLITGVGGMDGSHLADFLLTENYNVFGLIRRNSTADLENAKHLENKIDIIEGDITDMSSVLRIIDSTKPHEIYNLAAMSDVHTSFEQPLATINIDTGGLINILESIKILKPQTRVFQASTSEMFGASKAPQSFDSKFIPQSPYAIAKLASHHFIRLYRESYNMYVCSGVTYNHEGVRRGPKFVTRKISMGVAKSLLNTGFKLKLGNLNAKRDWGFAPDYVKGFWMALQQEKPNDYIFSTGEMHTVKEFCEVAFSYVGLDWENFVEVDRFFMRPAEVPELCGDFSKTQELIGWEPKVKFEELVKLMVDNDCRLFGLIGENETAENLFQKKCQQS
jgi:GDPmannose 4,6-dehydratase